jgi:hypothetical protein
VPVCQCASVRQRTPVSARADAHSHATAAAEAQRGLDYRRSTMANRPQRVPSYRMAETRHGALRALCSPPKAPAAYRPMARTTIRGATETDHPCRAAASAPTIARSWLAAPRREQVPACMKPDG